MNEIPESAAWYKSPMHKRVMNGMAGGATRPPLEHVADDGKPILVIASITPSEKPSVEGVKMPISQIAVELYQPLPGGTALGGRFAPSGLKVPHLEEAGPGDDAKADGARPNSP